LEKDLRFKAGQINKTSGENQFALIRFRLRNFGFDADTLNLSRAQNEFGRRARGCLRDDDFGKTRRALHLKTAKSGIARDVLLAHRTGELQFADRDHAF
jgi:hypothetical protein